MKNDARLFRSRLALVGIGVAGVVGLAIIALWRGSPPLPTKDDVRGLSVNKARSRASDLDMARLLEEVHRKEREEMERYKRLSPEEMIDEVEGLSPEEKKRLQEAMGKIREQEDSLAEISREVEEYVRQQEDEQAKIPEKKKPKKADLRLVVDAASVDLLPAQPLIVNVHLINEGQEAVAIQMTGRNVYVKRPDGKEHDRGGLIGCGSESSDPPLLKGGSRWSFQSDLALDLGYDRLTNTVILGEFRVRLESTYKDHGKVVADEFTVRIGAPTGDDETVQRQIFEFALHGFLGLATPSYRRVGSTEHSRLKDKQEAFAAVEDLCRRFPNSRYAPDLRVGFIIAAEQDMYELAPSEEGRIDLERRVRVMCQTMMDRDGPKSWARAEILLLIANCGFRMVDFPFNKKELCARFYALCPTDMRTPGVLPKRGEMQTKPDDE